MAKKWNTELIQEYLDTNHKGYSVSGNYLNTKSKLTFTCPKNHVAVKDFSDFRETKNKCNECRLISLRSSHLSNFYDEIKNSNYKVIAFICDLRVLVQCPNNHDIYEVKTSNFISGKRCPRCSWDRFAEERKNSYDDVKNYIESFGYILHSDEYINNESHLEVSCVNGHSKYRVIYNNFLKGHRCPYCTNSYKIPYEEIKERAKSIGFELITTETEYENTKTNLTLKCKKGHISNKTASSLHGCLYCHFENNRGENSSCWQGGITSINEYLRNYIDEWKWNSLKGTDFKCDIECTNENLEVHHLIPFSSLSEKMFEILNIDKRPTISGYSQDELALMRKTINQLHMKKLGVPLNKEVHFLFHQIFGYRNTDEEQYIFFKNNYNKFKSGEFTIQEYKSYLERSNKDEYSSKETNSRSK